MKGVHITSTLGKIYNISSSVLKPVLTIIMKLVLTHLVLFSNFSRFGEEIKIELSPEQENQKKLEPIFCGPMNTQNKYFIVKEAKKIHPSEQFFEIR